LAEPNGKKIANERGG